MTKLYVSSPDFIFFIFYHQAKDLIKSKIYKPLTPKSKNKPSENVCCRFFENKDVEFINVARILRKPDIVKPLPSSSVKFHMAMIT